MLFLALAAFLLPGLTWWVWLGDREQDPIISLAQILGISLSVIILLAEAVFFLGGSFSPWGIIILLGFFAAVLIFGIIKKGLKIPREARPYLWIGLVIFGLAVAWRLFQARELVLPGWVDSQHHYLIIKVMLEAHGLPHTLDPYLPTPFYYHYGFHAVTAFITAISGLEINQAMLIMGQILNAAIGLSVYTLGKTLFKDWRPALGAGLLVSFVTRMPAYYLTWGRYTLITGLVLLPLAMSAAIDLLDGKNKIRGALTLALLTGSVLLTHYFAALLLGLFLVMILIVFLIKNRRNFRDAVHRGLVVGAGAATGLFIASPWLIRVIRYSTLNTGVAVNLPESLSTVIADPGELEYISNLLGPASSHWLLFAGGLGLILGLIQRKPVGFSVWSLALAALSLPWSLSLDPFRPDHFAIVLFLPMVLWAGFLFWQAGFGLDHLFKQHWIQTLLLILIIAGWSAWAFPLQSDIVNAVTVLVTEDDLAALDWIKENAPPDARFFINTAYWLNDVYRGVDGGGWLLPYTGHWAVVPTVFYGYSPDIARNQQIQAWGEDASAISTCSPDFWALVEGANLNWIYIREGIGSLQPQGLEGCEALRFYFQYGQVYIYQIIK